MERIVALVAAAVILVIGLYVNFGFINGQIAETKSRNEFAQTPAGRRKMELDALIEQKRLDVQLAKEARMTAEAQKNSIILIPPSTAGYGVSASN